MPTHIRRQEQLGVAQLRLSPLWRCQRVTGLAVTAAGIRSCVRRQPLRLLTTGIWSEPEALFVGRPHAHHALTRNTLSRATLSASCLQVVVIRGDGSPWWEETANRTFDVPEAGDGLAVTCHMGGDGATDVAAGGGSPAAALAKPSRDDGFHSAIDMSVDMDDARKLNPAFNVQVPCWPARLPADALDALARTRALRELLDC